MKNPFARLFESPEQKASRALSVHYNNLPHAVWMPENYRSFVNQGFKINVVAYQAIMKIANSIGSIRWTAYDASGTQLTSSPFLDLINKPNPMQSRQEFWRQKVALLLLAGNGFDERIVNGSRVLELWTLRPDRMEIKPGPTGLPAYYEYRHGGSRVRFAADTLRGDSDIRHVRLFSPDHDWFGQSPMTAARFGISQHNEAMNWLMRLLQNSARPSGALELAADQNLSDEQFKRLREEVETQYSGSGNAGRPMLLEGGMKWNAMSLSPNDMAIIETKDSAARDISLAFGVPPLLLNIPGDNTYSNYREARLGFFEDTVIPLVDMLAQEMNEWLSPYFQNHRVAPDYDSIEAIAEKRRALWAMVDSADEITVNEARALKGFPPVPNPLGSMLMADLRSSRRGHAGPRSNNGDQLSEELAYGTTD